MAYQIGDRVRRKQSASVRKHQNVMSGVFHTAVQSRRFAAAPREHHDLNERIGKRLQELICVIGRTIRYKYDLELLDRIRGLAKVGNFSSQVPFLVVRGDDECYRGKLIGIYPRHAALAAPHQILHVAVALRQRVADEQNDRIDEIRVTNKAQGNPKNIGSNALEHAHRAPRPTSKIFMVLSTMSKSNPIDIFLM